MASRDPDDVLRNLRCRGVFVLVRRRSVASRKSRCILWKDRKITRARERIQDPWADKGSPGAERSTAKGKSLWKPGCDYQEVESSPCNDVVYSPDHYTQFSEAAGLPCSLCSCFSAFQPSSVSSRCWSTCSVVSDTKLNPAFRWRGHQNSVCSTSISVPHDLHISSDQPVLTSPEQSSQDQCVLKSFHPQECTITQETCAGLCHETTPPSQNLCPAHSDSQGTLVCKEDRQSQLVVTNRGDPDWKHRSDLDIACAPIRSKSVWLDWQQPSSRNLSSSVTSRVCSCSHCCPIERVLDGKNVCGSNVSVGINVVRGHSSAHVDSRGLEERSESCSLLCHVSPCLRCQQLRQLYVPSQNRTVLHKHEQAHITKTNPEQNTHLPLTTNCVSNCPNSELSDSQRGSCCQKREQWRRMVYMRYVGLCLLLLLLAAVGGLMAQVTINDHKTGNNQGGGAVGLADSHPVDSIMKMHMRPVPVREFQARLRMVRNKFDLLRIFLADKDISDDSLIKLLAASDLPSPSHPFLHSDVKRVAVTSSVNGDDAPVTTAPDSDLHIDDASEEDVQGRGFDPKLHHEVGLPKLTKSNQKDLRKDARKSDEVLRKAGRKSGKDLLKAGDSLLNEPNQPIKDHPKSDVSLSEIKSPSVNIHVTQNKNMNIDSKDSAALGVSTTQTDVSEGKLTSPKISDVKKGMSVDDVEVTKVRKREDMTYDDDDYPEDEEDIHLEDYFEGEGEEFNDAAKADAFLEELEEAMHAISEMENNPQTLCRDPRPHVLHIEDPKKQNRQFYPECIVIHRCRSDSGCCGRNRECGPKTEQVITRHFLIVHVNKTTDTVLPKSWMVEKIALVNHTECQCRERPRLPECNQTCPKVFRMYRYGSQCVCDCVSISTERFPQCEDVKNGLHPLSHDDLVCIKSGKCGQPRCSTGQFDVSSGFCPVEELRSIRSHQLHQRLRHQRRLRHHNPSKSAVEGSGDF